MKTDTDLLPGMPEPVKLSERDVLEREARNYEAAVSVHGPLVPPALGGRILRISPQGVQHLMKRGSLTRLDIFGTPWIPFNEVTSRLSAPRSKGGRPRKIA